MKRTLILLILLTFTIAVHSQHVSLTKQGFLPVVIEVDGQTAADLHAKVKGWITLNFVSPKNAITGDIDGKILKINGLSEQSVCYKSIGVKTCFDLQYVMEFQFREGRYRASIPDFIISNETRHPGVTYDTFLFKKDGRTKPIYQSVVDDINNHFNTMLSEVITFSNDEGIDEW